MPGWSRGDLDVGLLQLGEEGLAGLGRDHRGVGAPVGQRARGGAGGLDGYRLHLVGRDVVHELRVVEGDRSSGTWRRAGRRAGRGRSRRRRPTGSDARPGAAGGPPVCPCPWSVASTACRLTPLGAVHSTVPGIAGRSSHPRPATVRLEGSKVPTDLRSKARPAMIEFCQGDHGAMEADRAASTLHQREPPERSGRCADTRCRWRQPPG